MSTTEVSQYQDPKSLLVVNSGGQLRQLFVPFRVRCIGKLEHIPLNSWVYVDSVFLHRKYVLLYWIHQRLYPYHHFTVEINW